MKRLITIMLTVTLAISLLPVLTVPVMAKSAPSEIMLVEWSNYKDSEFIVSGVADALPGGDHGVNVEVVGGLDRNPSTDLVFNWTTKYYKISRICITYDGKVDERVVNEGDTSGTVTVNNAKIIKYITFYYVADENGDMAPIPEIATIGMFGIGLVGLGGIVWYRRRRSDSEIIA